MDAWQFPRGTKLWKEIARDGRRVETRFMEKRGDAPEDWTTVAYVWELDGRDALAAPEGREEEGVPAARRCMGCHGGTPGRVLGFSAIQLAGSDVLDGLLAGGRFTEPPPRAIPIPGDATTQAALGYLHANCAHCHNLRRPARTGARCFDPQKEFDLSLRTTELADVRATAAYRTAIGRIISAGDPSGSDLVARFEGTIPLAPRMPALGTKHVNKGAAKLLRRWISAL